MNDKVSVTIFKASENSPKMANITIPEETAQVLLSILGGIGGDPSGIRGLLWDLYDELDDKTTRHPNFSRVVVEESTIYISGKVLDTNLL